MSGQSKCYALYARDVVTIIIYALISYISIIKQPDQDAFFFFFAESTTPPHEQLPVVFESTDDPSLNLTRTDLNCDKTGTCYDGQCLYIIL